ncbi:UDP-N-acetylglucosamine 2-epimerase [Helicobacter sp. WB40]|uniref:UDP-N-acetylglucosamine 2-epimerase n=1 Tax=Helicobacter sp. WB40 TaxID=3004130 RepID=UPI0022EBD1B3|nr:UDP-N-acetylglucosamine 2-epimerase [Helicobacter sp. WB40]MDA3966761.1 UDP-N-acetylglucosamine 2-epimerase [Helicobacter sp. WB40]
MKKIVFITGTRADFSKIKSLIHVSNSLNSYKTMIFATGMHLSKKFGYTIKEIYKEGFKNVFEFINHDKYYNMDLAISSTIAGFSRYVAEEKPDLIIVHGDRLESLAAAIVGSFNNILVAHIEGGEISGTIDNSIRHSISKLAHIHLVNDKIARKRLIQMGEHSNSIFIIGSPDLEILYNNKISIEMAKSYYNIPYKEYSIVLFHPVTTEILDIKRQSEVLVKALKANRKNYIIIYPNNDLGFEFILENYEKLKKLDNFRIFPLLRFEYFITLLKHSQFIIGNSSCLLKEAPMLSIPAILLGSRQQGRVGENLTIKTEIKYNSILDSIAKIKNKTIQKNSKITVNSSLRFKKLLTRKTIFDIEKQKTFKDII